jgi:hypothetical protein
LHAEVDDGFDADAAPSAMTRIVLLALVACAGEPVGRKCDLGGEPAPSEVLVNTASLDCVSRTCLRVPLGRDLPPGGDYPTGTTGLCTAACATDDDCQGVAETPCRTGFTCGIPPGETVGAECCQKLCVCRDYVALDETGHLEAPLACDPTISTNTCCNLEGRLANPAYPQCAP